MGETKHSMRQAVEIQKAFEEKFGGEECLVGIGIGLNSSRDDLAQCLGHAQAGSRKAAEDF